MWNFLLFLFFRNQATPYPTTNAVFTATIALSATAIFVDPQSPLNVFVVTRIELIIFGALIGMFLELVFFPVYGSTLVEQGCASYFLQLSDTLATIVDGCDVDDARRQEMVTSCLSITAAAEGNISAAISEPFIGLTKRHKYDEMFARIIEIQVSARKLLRTNQSTMVAVKQSKDLSNRR